MASRITYEDKEKIYDDPKILEKNKATDKDFNNIKKVVNDNAEELEKLEETVKNLHNYDDTGIKEDISNIKEEQQTQNEDISSIKEKNTEQDTNINKNANDIIELKEKDTSTDTEIANLKKKDTEHDTKIKAVEDKNTEQGTEIQGIKDRLDTIEEEQQTQNEDIEDLKAENEKLKEENQALREDMNSILPYESNTGENITANNTTGARFRKFRVTGNSVQKTQEQGKNLFDLTKVRFNEQSNNITYEDLKPNEITISFSGKENTSPRLLRGMFKSAPGTYHVRGKIEILEGTASITPFIQFTNEDWAGGSTRIFSSEGTISKEFVIHGSTVTENARIGFIMSENGETSEVTAPRKVRFYDLQISKEDAEYEPYQPAIPSPEYPSEIKNCKGTLNNIVDNKNLFDVNDKEGNSRPWTGETTVDKDGWITITKNTTGSTSYPKAYINPSKALKPNTKYYIVYEIKSVNGSGVFYINTNGDDYLSQFKDNMNYDFTNFKNGDIKVYELTTIDNFDKCKTMLRTYIGFNTTQTGSITFRISILEQQPNAVNFIYTPHQETPYPFPLEEGQVLHKGDSLEDEGICDIWDKKVVNGTEEWSIYDTAPNQNKTTHFALTYKNANLNNNTVNTMCETLKSDTANNIWNNDIEAIGQSAGNVVVRINKTRASTVEELKAYLKENPITVYLRKATPTITPYTEAQQKAYDKLKQAKTYEGTTHIYSPDEVSPIYEEEHYIPLQLTSTELQTQINEIKELISTSKTSAMLVENLENDLVKEVE